MISKKELIELCAGLEKEKKYKPFIKLLAGIESKFEKDPIEVLMNSEIIRIEDDKKLLGKCICSKSKLRFLYTASYHDTEYTLGSNCVNCLSFCYTLKTYLIENKNMSEEQLEDINKINLIYESFKSLEKIPCKNPSCKKKINITSDLIKNHAQQQYKEYCKKCINEEGMVKCVSCSNYKIYNDKLKCKECILSSQGLKYCNVMSCKAVIQKK